MLILRVGSKRYLPCVKNVFFESRCLATQEKAKPKMDLAAAKQSLPRALPKKPRRDPFLKNLFLGKFDYEFLRFPEPQQSERYYEFQDWLQPVQHYIKTVNAKEIENTSNIPSHIIEKFRELKLFGLRIGEDYYGINLLNSEFLQVLETVATIPVLGMFLLKQAVPAIDIFNKFCTVEQKWKYLPKIAIGQSFATVAISEIDCGPSIKNYKTSAVLSDCKNYWVLNGEKSFVNNIDVSDLFIVVANAHSKNDQIKDSLSSFIVEKETEGVTVVQDYVETTGLKGFKSGRILLKNVRIPKENMIGEIGDGEKHSIHLFSGGRHFIASLTISLLRNFLNHLIKDVTQRRYFDKMLYETDLAKSIIGNLTSSIYAMESVLYLTTTVMDIYDDQDVLLESAVVEQYCVEECLKVLQNSMWLIGPRSCTLVEPYEQLLRDAFTITNFETSLIDTKIYSALLGLQHCGLNLKDYITVHRNPLMYPKQMLKHIMTKRKRLDLHLYEHIHPSLRECSQICEDALQLLKDSSLALLIGDGKDAAKNHASHQRLSDIVSNIYVYIAMLSRASRSYCIGNRNSESEVKICMAFAPMLDQKVSNLHNDISVYEFANGDHLKKELSQLTFEAKKYIAAHPLQRNFA